MRKFYFCLPYLKMTINKAKWITARRRRRIAINMLLASKYFNSMAIAAVSMSNFLECTTIDITYSRECLTRRSYVDFCEWVKLLIIKFFAKKNTESSAHDIMEKKDEVELPRRMKIVIDYTKRQTWCCNRFHSRTIECQLR